MYNPRIESFATQAESDQLTDLTKCSKGQTENVNASFMHHCPVDPQCQSSLMSLNDSNIGELALLRSTRRAWSRGSSSYCRWVGSGDGLWGEDAVVDEPGGGVEFGVESMDAETVGVLRVGDDL